MRLSFVFLQLLSIINTLRGVSGEPEKTSDNLHIKFEKHIEFEDDWEDDFYQHFKKFWLANAKGTHQATDFTALGMTTLANNAR